MKKYIWASLAVLVLFVVITNVAHADITSGLQGWWKFDEGSGSTATDSSGNSLTGNYFNSPTYATGKIGAYALSLNNANQQYMALSSASSLALTTGTISAWIKAPTVCTSGSYCGIITKQSAYGMFMISNGHLVAYDWGSGNSRDSGVTISDGNWHLVTETFQSGVANGSQLYVDGVAAGPAFTITVNSQGVPFQVGNGGNASQWFPGLIDDARVYNRVLTSSDVSELYAYTGSSGSGDITSGLQGLWSLDDGNTSSAFDSSGNGNNATISGSPTYVTGKIGDSAISLNGSSQYLQIPSAVTSYPTSGSTNSYAITFSSWFKTSTGGIIFAQDANVTPPSSVGGYVPAIYVNPSTGKIHASLFWHGNTNNQIISANSYKDGSWHQVIDTYSNGTETLYVDGVNVGSQSVGESSYSVTYAYFAGTGYGGSWPGLSSGWNYFNGSLDDIRIYNRALSSTDVSKLYSYAGSGLFSGGGNSNPLAPTNSSPLSGWAWTSNTGWISFNSSDSGTGNGGTGLSPVQYGVSISTSTNPATFSGDAWSSNVGWVSFDPNDVSGCPGGAVTAPVDANGNLSGQVTGYVRVLNAKDGKNGWDGCVKLGDPSSSDYQYSPQLSTVTFKGADNKDYLQGGVTYSQSLGFFRGFAWSGNASTTGLGWISFENPLAPVKPCTGPNCTQINGPDFQLSPASVALTTAKPSQTTNVSILRNGIDTTTQVITPSLGTLPSGINAKINNPPATCTLDTNTSTCNVSVTVTLNNAADGAYTIPVVGTRSDSTTRTKNITVNVTNTAGGAGPVSLYIGPSVSSASTGKTTSYTVKKGNPFALVWNINLDTATDYSCGSTVNKGTWPVWTTADLSQGNLSGIDTSTNSASSYTFNLSCTSSQGNPARSAAATLILQSSSESEF